MGPNRLAIRAELFVGAYEIQIQKLRMDTNRPEEVERKPVEVEGGQQAVLVYHAPERLGGPSAAPYLHLPIGQIHRMAQ